MTPDELLAAALEMGGRVVREHSRPITPEESAREWAKFSELLDVHAGDWEAAAAELNRWADEQGLP